MKRLLIVLAVALLQACGGGGGGTSTPTSPTPPDTPSSPQACSVQDQRDTVLSFMKDEYFWYKDLGTPDANATTMEAWFKSMLYKPADRFSFTEPTSDYEQLFEQGTFTGYGYSLAVVDQAPTLRVRTVEPKGPAYAAGLRRGDTILSVDGQSPAQVLTMPRVTTEGVPRTMQVRDVAGNTKTLQMVSATFALTPVRDATVLTATRNGQPVKVGYLNYTQFVDYSQEDLLNTIHSFVEQGATELVLDLRYNGGGDVYTSRYLASLIAGTRVAAQVFTSLRFNDKHQADNQDIKFLYLPGGMQNLPRVFVIASGGTASASELVINGLKPFMDVVLIGDTTYGKPFGFVPFSYCGTTYNAVNFESVNSLGVGGYTAGFAPTCPVADDLDHQLGDPNERELKTALGYIANGTCPQPSQAAAASFLSSAKSTPRVLGDVVAPGMFRK